MGQYYFEYVREADGKEHFIDTKCSDGEHVMLKLMEHSWWNVDFTNTIVSMIWQNPCTVCWIGDYAWEDALEEAHWCMKSERLLADRLGPAGAKRINERLWGKDELLGNYDRPKKNPMTLDGAFLVDHTRGEYFDCDEYFAESCNGQCIHPLPLLTCAGNGLGGGDYDGTYMGLVGKWCGDVVSAEPKPAPGEPEPGFVRKYRKISPVFREDWDNAQFNAYVEIDGKQWKAALNDRNGAEVAIGCADFERGFSVALFLGKDGYFIRAYHGIPVAESAATPDMGDFDAKSRAGDSFAVLPVITEKTLEAMFGDDLDLFFRARPRKGRGSGEVYAKVAYACKDEREASSRIRIDPAITKKEAKSMIIKFIQFILGAEHLGPEAIKSITLNIE